MTVLSTKKSLESFSFRCLFNMMLVNSYLFSLYNDPEFNSYCFTDQKQFRTQFYQNLFWLANEHCTKRPYREYILELNITKLIHPSTFRNIFEKCHGCKLKKRQILSKISRNSAFSRPWHTKYGCNTCDLLFCRGRNCFDSFHSGREWIMIEAESI